MLAWKATVFIVQKDMLPATISMPHIVDHLLVLLKRYAPTQPRLLSPLTFQVMTVETAASVIVL